MLCARETILIYFPGPKKSNSNHVNKWKNGQILHFCRKKGGIIRLKEIFFETFWANSSGGFETFFLEKFTSFHLSFSLHFRGAGTHGDVLNLHTEVSETDTRGRGGGEKEGEGRGVTVSSANHETAHVELSRALERFTERNPWFLPIQGLRTGREQHVPESSNHSLYLTKLLSSILS